MYTSDLLLALLLVCLEPHHFADFDRHVALATVIDPPDKLILHAKTSDDEQLEQEDIIPWCNQPSGEFLYAIATQLSEKE